MPVYDREYLATRKANLAPSSWLCAKGSGLNFTLRTGQKTFGEGFIAGTVLGLYLSTKNQRILTVPKYAFGVGAAWASLSMFTSLFRNSI